MDTETDTQIPIPVVALCYFRLFMECRDATYLTVAGK